MSEHTDTDPTRIAFVCVQNAGRSQMAYAFAQQEVERRELENEIELITGGTHPANQVHEEAVRAMHSIGIDISNRTPRDVTFEELQQSDSIITMGCSADDVCPAGWAGENHDWDLDDPDGKSPTDVAEIRDEIQSRVSTFFDELETTDRTLGDSQ